MTKEQQIEDSLIRHLQELKYTYRPDIRDLRSLEDNFRAKFNARHRVTLSDIEWVRLKEHLIKSDVFDTSRKLRETADLTRDDGTPLYYTLMNVKDWCKNDFEVIHQLRINTASSHQRYDVILLINGLPVVQIELKNLQFSPRKAMQQIVDYKSEPGNGYGNSLLCFMQLFIVSNRSDTRYFANNNSEHFAFNANEQFLPVYQLADEKNEKIRRLEEFTDKFLGKCTLGEMISKYMVLVQVEKKILIMRPYQIYAVKAIMQCIEQNRGNGYIWHTTGSGKTLTSFKASTLIRDMAEIEKCLFVVDRKDLDRQTRMEFNKFQEGSVEDNTNTETLVRRLLSTSKTDKVIVTTIQKLGLALDGSNAKNYKARLKDLAGKRVVFIFDECHRSQFGDNHKAIKEFFPKAQLFGFTGTPIFEENASDKVREGETGAWKTTKSIFQEQLHEYTITHAIEDRNVLRFHIDYYKGKGSYVPQPGEPVAKQKVVEAILSKHQAATNGRKFNAIFATQSINDAIDYYRLFKEIQEQKMVMDAGFTPLNIACVFSPPAEGNKDIQQIQEDLDQEREDNRENPEEKKRALKEIMADYNRRYGHNHSLSEFDSYYQDIQKRIKDQKYNLARREKIDLTIVVDMLLTGFDSQYLNTLYVDKNLKAHGLIQAFSRTNRVLNDSKPFGNILDYRSQQAAVNKAITLFSGENTERPVEIWEVPPASKVITDFREAVKNLGYFMDEQNLVHDAGAVYNIKGDTSRIEFVKKFKEVQRLKTQLDQYTDLEEEQHEAIEDIMPEDTFLEFRSSYLETAKQLQAIQQKEGDDAPPEIQELDFEYVLFASALIDYDYIMGLIAANSEGKPSSQRMTREQVKTLLKANSNLMDEEEDLSEYIDSLEWGVSHQVEELKKGFETFRREKQERFMRNLAQTHGLPLADLQAFVNGIMERKIFDGEKLTDLLAPLELGWKDRRLKELSLMDDLVPHLQKLAAGAEISGLNAYE
ncbi:MAG: type I restriction endonuclease subunit R [Bacteroidia bacterium]|nr:type I restriction endonuclease subunit R [Bacteroidia bacterium]